MTRQTTEESDDVGEEIHGIYPRRGFIRPSSPASKVGVPGLTGWTASLLRVLNRCADLNTVWKFTSKNVLVFFAQILRTSGRGYSGMQASSRAKPKPIVAINCRPMSSQHLMRTWGGSTR